jgi:hypothetical protein
MHAPTHPRTHVCIDCTDTHVQYLKIYANTRSHSHGTNAHARTITHLQMLL